MAATLPLRHFLLALAVVAVWGSNFVVARFALAEMPPLLLSTLRFTLAFLPAAFFLKRPAVPWRYLAAYGVLIGVGQFGLLYIAMDGWISPGLASLVVQTQAFFTIGLAMGFAGERLRPFQGVALAVALLGILVILFHTDAETTPLGLVLVLLAAVAWAGGNFVAMQTPRVNMLAYVVWSSLYAVPPLILLSLLFDGAPRLAASLTGMSLTAWAAVFWQAFANALFGYSVWGWLLGRHPAATIMPIVLLVPVFGMAGSALILGEALTWWKLAAAGLVIAGLAINLLWPRLRG